MNNRNAKLARKAANEAASQTSREAAAALMQVTEYTRKVELMAQALETAVGSLEGKARAWHAFRLRSFMGRLRWLFTGR